MGNIYCHPVSLKRDKYIITQFCHTKSFCSQTIKKLRIRISILTNGYAYPRCDDAVTLAIETIKASTLKFLWFFWAYDDLRRALNII